MYNFLQKCYRYSRRCSAMNDTLLTQLRIAKMSNIKPNFSELARISGIDRRTIKKYYDGYSGKPAHHNKPSYLDNYKNIIINKLQIKGATVKAVYEYLITEVDAEIGTYSNFNKYVKSKGLQPKKCLKGHPHFETPPGRQAQVDWKEDITIHNRNGESFTFQIFTYKLGHSRYCHFVYKLYKTRQDVFDCLIAAFKATGGVPREILFDNMASVVDMTGNKRRVNPKFYAFAKDFNFKVRLCKPRHPFTKGKVEAANKFMDWILPYEGEFDSEDELIKILDKIKIKVNGSISQATGIAPIILLQKETEHLQPLPKPDIIKSYLSYDRQTTVRKDSMITYMSRKYSVSPEFIGKPVHIKVAGDKLMIYYNTNLIATHSISNKKFNYSKEHYCELLKQSISDNDAVTIMAESNLMQMDTFILGG